MTLDATGGSLLRAAARRAELPSRPDPTAIRPDNGEPADSLTAGSTMAGGTAVRGSRRDRKEDEIHHH